MKKIKTIQIFNLLLLFSFWSNSLIAQVICDPDVVAPNVACNTVIFEDVVFNEQLTVTAQDILEAANDNCTDFADLEFFITDDMSLVFPPATTSVTFPLNSSGTIQVSIWVVDQSGNFNTCWSNVFINQLSESCPMDTIAPDITCNSFVYVYSPAGQDFAINPNMIIQIGTDNCTLIDNIDYFLSADPSLTSPPTTDTIYFPASSTDTVSVYVWAVDEAGNFSSCESELALNTGNPGPCGIDTIAPYAICDIITVATGLPGNDFAIPAQLLDDGSSDNCTASSALEFFITLDGSLTSPPTTDTLFFPAGTNDTVLAFMWVVDLAGNANVCVVEVILQSLEVIQGKVFIDDNQNCLLDTPDENGIDGFTIRYTLDQGLSYTTINTFPNGNYFNAINTQGATEITIELLLPNGISTSCVTSQTLQIPIGSAVVDFPVQLASDCNNMVVDVSSFIVRTCSTNLYFLDYCNLSSYDIDSAEILLTLPSDMSVVLAAIPYTDLGNNSYLFELGTVPAGTCDNFPLSIFLDCTTPWGVTRCVEAVISPNDCTVDSLNWTTSNLIVEGECDDLNSLVRFTITNQSSEPMLTERTATVVEDVVMYMTTPVQLGPGAVDVLEFPANGSTWRVEIPQEDGHPSLSIPSAMIEGCGGYGSMGFINQFSTPDVDPFISIDCAEVLGPYDPNDKQAYPIGVSDEHFIEPNTSLEYKIRFQNTGNDTAFVVRVEDKLSSHLDWTSVEGGASSHPYRIGLQEGGLLVFHFEDILLPDSTTNLEASQGFVKFRIHQLVDNAIGTLIENTADIYFDFNEAVVTNTVFHNIGINFIPTSTIKTVVPNLDLTIAPNPFSDYTIFTLNGVSVEDGKFELYDLAGRLVKEENFYNNQFRLERNGLPNGAYFFRFKNAKGLLVNGKLIVN